MPQQSRPLWVQASQPQFTPAGDLLGRMYYGSFLRSVLDRDEYSGYPHNGGEHTLHLRLNDADLAAFLELVQDAFRGRMGVQEFVASVQEAAAKRRRQPVQLH